MSDENPIYAKIRKLLALSQNEGATEAEASVAAMKVQQLCQDHGLDLAQIGDDPGPDGRRQAGSTDRRAMYDWQQVLMGTLAECNFCLHEVRREKVQKRGKNRLSKRHFLVGRRLNVDVVLSLYDYLVSAMKRLAEREDHAGSQIFMEGAARRVCDRLRDQRREREHAEKLRRREARARGEEVNALVVTDVYSQEKDLNNDTLNGFPPGTTAARREKMKDDERVRRENEKKMVEEGMDPTVAFYVSNGYTQERAEEIHHAQSKRQRRRSRRSTNSWGGRSTGFRRGSKRDKKYDSDAYQAGDRAGQEIGLDRQVGEAFKRRIG